MARHAGAVPIAVACVIVGVAVTAPLTSGEDTVQVWGPTVGLVAHIFFVVCAASIYFHWRQVTASRVESVADVTYDRTLGWLVVILLVVSLPTLVLRELASVTWLLLSQIVVVAALILLTRVSRRVDVVTDPALLGLLTGMGISAVFVIGDTLAPAFPSGALSTAALVGVLGVAGLVLARDLLSQPLVPTWARRRLAFCVVALVAAQTAGQIDGLLYAEIAIVGYVAAASVISATALRLEGRALEEYEVEVHQMQAQVSEQRELLHELGATLAGIASASELIREHDKISAQRRQRLERMMESEVARMVRLLSDRAESLAVVEVQVDAIVGPLVLSHQARGRDVRWNDSWLTLQGRADDIAEIVNILLENAARHAGDAPVVLTASGPTDDGMVEISCIDLGPGIARDLRTQLFEVGVRRDGSPGQGLGLAIARRLATDLGGALDLHASPRGAHFVVSIPAGPHSLRGSDVVAHAS